MTLKMEKGKYKFFDRYAGQWSDWEEVFVPEEIGIEEYLRMAYMAKYPEYYDEDCEWYTEYHSGEVIMASVEGEEVWDHGAIQGYGFIHIKGKEVIELEE